MNILFLLTNYPGFGGIEKVTAYITSFLKKKGFSLSVLAYGTNAPQLIDTLSTDVTPDYVPEPYQYSSTVNNDFICQYLHNKDFDFVVLQDSYAPIEHLLTEINYPWMDKLIVVEHNSPMYALKTVNSYFYYNADLKFFAERIIKYPLSAWKAFSSSCKRHTIIFENSRKYVLLSDTFRSELNALVNECDKSKVISISNPLTISKPKEERVITKKKQILFVGRMTNQKGLNFLLKIWKEFSIKMIKRWGGNGWNLIILGNGPLRAEVESYIKQNKLSNIKIVPPTPAVDIYYEESAILLLTSIYEGFGLVLTEAMSRGCVPMAFDSFNSVHDIIDSGKNGILIRPFKITDYVNNLMRLVQDEHRLKLMSVAAKDVIRKFNIEIIGNQWIRLFEELYEDNIRNKSCEPSSDTSG